MHPFKFRRQAGRLAEFARILAAGLLFTACGGDGGSSPPTEEQAALALFAGNLGGLGNSDGVGPDARFRGAIATAINVDGNVYVADRFNYTIRKITPAGVVTTLAGQAGVAGHADGTGTEARFSEPTGVAVDTAGNVYVADFASSTIRKITSTGIVTTFAGLSGVGGSADGKGAEASFAAPIGVSTDASGNVYVADYGNSTIRRITPAGVVTTLAGSAGIFGSADGIGAAASFWAPRGVAADSAGNVYVADTGTSTIRKVTPAGEVTTLAGTAGVVGSTDGAALAATFNHAEGIAVDSAGNLYVSDTGNNRIRKITVALMVSTLAGSGAIGSSDGPGDTATFGFCSLSRLVPPKPATPQCRSGDLAADRAGNVYVADSSNATVRRISPAGEVSTLAGRAEAIGSADGTGDAARFYGPDGAATDGDGNVYVADRANHTIRKITTAGVVTTLAGRAGVPGSVDGAGAEAGFLFPAAVATDTAGNIYVADSGNSTIRKITRAGVVTTLAGLAGVVGSVDGVGADARFRGPHGVATDTAGNVYVADLGNVTIRKITSAGVVSTLAGQAGVAGNADGATADARFDEPYAVATDRAGNVYVADANGNTLRKITPAGIVSTLAGRAGVVGSADGAGAGARFFRPEGVATDNTGNVYVADTGNSTLRRISPAGLVTTVAGVPGRHGFTPGALPGVLSSPRGVAVHGTTVYLTLYNGVAVVKNTP